MPGPKPPKTGHAASSKCPVGSAPARLLLPPQGAPGGSGQLGTCRKRSAHRAPRHRLGCSSEPPPKPPIPPPLTMQATPRRRAGSRGNRSRPRLSPCPRTPCATPASRRSGRGVEARGHSSTEARKHTPHAMRHTPHTPRRHRPHVRRGPWPGTWVYFGPMRKRVNAKNVLLQLGYVVVQTVDASYTTTTITMDKPRGPTRAAH